MKIIVGFECWSGITGTVVLFSVASVNFVDQRGFITTPCHAWYAAKNDCFLSNVADCLLLVQPMTNTITATSKIICILIPQKVKYGVSLATFAVHLSCRTPFFSGTFQFCSSWQRSRSRSTFTEVGAYIFTRPFASVTPIKMWHGARAPTHVLPSRGIT